MSDNRRKGKIGVNSGEWLSVDEFALSLGKGPVTEAKPGPTATDTMVAATHSAIAMRGKLPTLDIENDQDGRITLDQIDPFVPPASALPEIPTGLVSKTNRPAGGEVELQELDDKASGESLNLMLCVDALQRLSMKIAVRKLIPGQASMTKRYFLFGFPATEGLTEEMVMRTRIFDQEDLNNDAEALNSALLRLPGFKEEKSRVINREDRINLIKALTVFYAAYGGDYLEGVGVDYLKALDSLNKFEFKPVSPEKRGRILAVSGDALKTFDLRMKKFFFEKGIVAKKPLTTSPVSEPVVELRKEAVSDMKVLFASIEAERIIKGLKGIGYELRRALPDGKVERDVAVVLIKDILEDGPIEVADYIKTFKLDRIDASALLRLVFECRLPVSAMGIEEHYVYMILGQFLINSADLSENDFKRFVAYLMANYA